MPTDFPDKIRVSEYFHPMIIATVLTPKQFEGAVSNLCMVSFNAATSTISVCSTENKQVGLRTFFIYETFAVSVNKCRF